MVDVPLAGLLLDQQIRLERGKISTYAELAFKIQKPEGLAAGNLSIAWDPSRETVTIHRLEIRRGDQVIDVLKSGQRFTTVRREQNLEFAVINGVLTANIQPEDLREGDVVVLATTNDHSDPVLRGHVEAAFAIWGSARVEKARARVSWPTSIPLKVKNGDGLPPLSTNTFDGLKSIEIRMDGLEPEILPKNAPARFNFGRMAEATDFASWADAGKLMAPLFRAPAIPPSGPLRDEVEKIRKASSDAKTRAGLALQLAQQRVRYVALLLGQGGYVPATPEETWSRRFGDCKAKTALLIAMLREFGIEADAVAVNSSVGDAVVGRLPMIGVFDHVLVRARIAGKDLWLDGTRTGDTNLDRIAIPDFGWGLPLTDNAQLIRIISPPLTEPSPERTVEIDARDGVYTPAKFKITEVQRGDNASLLATVWAQLSPAQRDEAAHASAEKYFDNPETTSPSFNLDQGSGESRLVVEGRAKLEWNRGWLYVPTSEIAFNPDFHRPPGPQREVPFAIAYPRYVKDRAIVRLPPGFAARQEKESRVHETLAGVEYHRDVRVENDSVIVDSSERSLGPEVTYKEAIAAETRLKSLNDDDVHLRIPGDYRMTDSDSEARLKETPSSARDYFERGLLLLNTGKYDESIADLDQVIRLEPKNEWGLANRALAHAWKENFEAAERDLAALAAINGANPIAYHARAMLAQRKSDFKAAISAYDTSLKIDPNDMWALAERADAKRRIGDESGALADSAAVLAKDSSQMEMRLLRANLFFSSGRKQDAAREAQLLTEQNPRSEYAFVAAGRIYGRLGRKNEALEAFDRAIALKPDAYVYLNRAQVRPASDRQGRLADIDLALKAEPGMIEAIAEKARIAFDDQQFRAAADLYAQALKAEPDSRSMAVRMGVAIYKAGDIEAGAKQLADLRRSAKTASDYNDLCWIEATAGILLTEAEQNCVDAIRLAPDSGSYLDSMGMALLKLGKVEESLIIYSKAIEKKTGSNSYMGRAFALLRKGDTARAESDRARARELDPEIDEEFSRYGLTF